MAWDGKIPFTVDGDLVEFAGHRAHDYDFKENFTFTTTLTLQRTMRGRSAAKFIWTDPDDHTYPMFMKDMLEVAKTRTIEQGRCTGAWTFVKRGQNYGVTCG